MTKCHLPLNNGASVVMGLVVVVGDRRPVYSEILGFFHAAHSYTTEGEKVKNRGKSVGKL